MKNLKISTILLMTLVIFGTSCAKKKKEKQELEAKKTEIAQAVSEYVYPLPSSFELMDMLNEIDAAFIIGISNPPTSVEKYTTEAKQALNLGVYMADLSYASIYQRKQAAQDYLKAAEVLVRKLHVDDSFEQEFVSEASTQLDNRDTLISLLTDATQNIYSDLHRKGHESLAYLMLAGTWTEAMHLTLEVSSTTPLNAQIIKTIIFQHQSLLETINLLQEVKDIPEASPILTAMMVIKNVFDQEDPGSLTAAQVTQLTAKTDALRTLIIE